MKQSKERKEEILRSLPEGVRRVQVVSEDGKQQYKRPDEINLEKDEIMLSSDGSPIVMKGKPGRKPKAVLKPVSPAAALLCQARAEHLGADRLLETVSTDSESEKVIEGILSALAEDAAVIDFEKEEAFRMAKKHQTWQGKEQEYLKVCRTYGLGKGLLWKEGLLIWTLQCLKNFFRFYWKLFGKCCFSLELQKST